MKNIVFFSVGAANRFTEYFMAKRDFLVLDDYPYTLKLGDTVTLYEDDRVPGVYVQTIMAFATSDGRNIYTNWSNQATLCFPTLEASAWAAVIRLMGVLTGFSFEAVEEGSDMHYYRLVGENDYKYQFRDGDTAAFYQRDVGSGVFVTEMGLTQRNGASVNLSGSLSGGLGFVHMKVHAWSEIMHLFGALTQLRYDIERDLGSHDSILNYNLRKS